MTPLFYIASFVTVFSVVLMIVLRNPIASAISLVISFFSLAVVYVTLDAHFVAALQILVYAGAIMVLFIFVIMLLNLRGDEVIKEKLGVQGVLAAFFGLGLFAFLAYHVFKIPAVAFPALPDHFGDAPGVATLLLTDYVVPFEVMGILLLVGLVGAVVLAKRED